MKLGHSCWDRVKICITTYKKNHTQLQLLKGVEEGKKDETPANVSCDKTVIK